MDFTSKILVEKTDEGQRTSVGEKGFSSEQLLLLNCLLHVNSVYGSKLGREICRI